MLLLEELFVLLVGTPCRGKLLQPNTFLAILGEYEHCCELLVVLPLLFGWNTDSGGGTKE